MNPLEPKHISDRCGKVNHIVINHTRLLELYHFDGIINHTWRWWHLVTRLFVEPPAAPTKSAGQHCFGGANVGFPLTTGIRWGKLTGRDVESPWEILFGQWMIYKWWAFHIELLIYRRISFSLPSGLVLLPASVLHPDHAPATMGIFHLSPMGMGHHVPKNILQIHFDTCWYKLIMLIQFGENLTWYKK